MAVLVGLMGPDADVFLGLLTGRGMGYYHNGASHSLFFGIIFGVLFAWVCRRISNHGAKYLFLIGWATYTSHVLLDALTWGSGVQMFWPISDSRIGSPIPLFLGVRHSVNAPFHVHLLTVANDLTFALMVWVVCRFLWRRNQEQEPQKKPRQVPCAASVRPKLNGSKKH